MTEELTRAEFEAYAALLAGSTLLQRAIERNLQEQADITQVQFEILMELSSEPDGIRMAGLADRLIVSRSGLTYQVNKLEKRGLIARERHGDDERGIVAKITDAGEALRHRIYPGHLQIAREHFFSKITREELASLSASMTRVADGLR